MGTDRSELEILASAYGRTEPLLRALNPQVMQRRTPCEEWDVGTLATHMVTGVQGFATMLGGGRPDWDGEPPRDGIADAFDRACAANLEAWRRQGAVDTPVSALPGMRLVDLNLADAVVHHWDLATAIGHDPDLDDDAVETTLDIWSKAPLDVSRSMGAFGPSADAAEDAPALERLLALLGRDPAWRPPVR